MEDRTEEEIILVDLNNKESIRDALNSFKRKVENEELEIGQDEEYNTCFAKLSDGKIERFTVDDIKDFAFVDNVLVFSGFGRMKDVVENYYLIFYYEVFSNVVILNAALDHEDLKEDVLALVKSILVLVNKLLYNDNLWIDHEHVFGIDFLVALSLKYPEYTYLISDYIFHDWEDNEEASYVYYIMPVLKRYWGGKYDRNILKAIAYCNNKKAFSILVDQCLYEGEVFSETGELFKFFKENPSEFDYFKQEFIQFAKDSQRIVRFSDGTSFAEFIIRKTCPELTQEQWKNEIFLNDTYENTVADFEIEVDEVIKENRRGPIYNINAPYVIKDKIESTNNRYVSKVKEAEEVDSSDDKKDWDSDLDDEAYEEFFKKGFVNGEIVWNYIIEGKNSEVLETIEPASLMHIARSRNLKIRERLDYFGADLDKFIKPLLHRFYNEDVVKYRDIILRIMDVLFELGGKKLFDRYTMDILITDNNICTLDVILERYQSYDESTYLEDVAGLLNPFIEDFMSRNQLDQIYYLYKRQPEKWGDILSTIKQDVEAASGSQLLSLAYICYKEGASLPDENTKPLIEFFVNNFWNAIIKDLKSYANFNVEDLDVKLQRVREYCIGDTETSLSKEEVAALMEEFYVDENSSEELGINNIELFFSEDIHMLLASMVYAQRGLPTVFENSLNRMFHLILNLAPCRTLHSVFKMFCPDTLSFSADVHIMADYLDILSKLRVPLEYVMAWKITYTQNHFYKKMDMCIKIHDKILKYYSNLDSVDKSQSDMLVDEERREKEALRKCIQYLDNDNKDKFFEFLNEKYPSIEHNKVIKKKFDRRLKKFCDLIIENRTGNPRWAFSSEERLLSKLENKKAYELIQAYIFDNASFKDIEIELLPKLGKGICYEISQIIWELDDEFKYRALYMLGRFGDMNCIYDIFWAWNDKDDTKVITFDFFNLLIEIGLGSSFAFHFILKSYQRTVKDYEFKDNEFAQVFHSKYPEYDLYEEIKDLPNNLIVFALQQLSRDLFFVPQMRKFTKHIDRKVSNEAVFLLKRRKISY